MHLEDWREWPRARLAELYAREVDRWRAVLGWDASPLFDVVEQARASSRLPGFLAVDDGGRVVGWCYAHVQDGWLFIGALHGQRAEVVRLLLDHVLASPEAACVRAYRCFVFPETSAVATALARRRFEVEPFLYLGRAIAPAYPAGAADAFRSWGLEDVPETARLLARAYAGSVGSRCFAPSGRLDEWAGYLGQLVRTPACGSWAPDESLLCPHESASGGLAGVLLATRLSGDTTHVAQLAVDPAWRGRGVAAALVNQSAALAAARGGRQQTLLVGESNATARALYRRLGFVEITRFLFADRPRITRGSSGVTVGVGEVARPPA